MLHSAEQADYEVLITADKQIQFQQNSQGRKIIIVVLNSRRIVIEEIAPLTPEVVDVLRSLPQGVLILVNRE